MSSRKTAVRRGARELSPDSACVRRKSAPNQSLDTEFTGATGDKEKIPFPVQLITSRIGNHTRLMPSLVRMMAIHTC